MKYNLKLFEKAADLVNGGDMDFCCVAIRGSQRYWENPSPPERILFEEIYDVSGHISFNFKSINLIGRYFTDSELKETRLLALCFVHEIARRLNKGEKL